MFSGIVETLGTVSSVKRTPDLLKMSLTPSVAFNDVKVGDSVSVNGVCLTVTEQNPNYFNVDVVPETLKLTNLNHLDINHYVNLERSLQVGSRNGGHNVQGHIDGRGEILSIEVEGSEALLVKIRIPQNLKKYIVRKGYITVDGMSLTVIDVGNDWFSITLIPHTQQVTIAHQYSVGTSVNIEVDILGKYIENFIKAQS